VVVKDSSKWLLAYVERTNYFRLATSIVIPRIDSMCNIINENSNEATTNEADRQMSRISSSSAPTCILLS